VGERVRGVCVHDVGLVDSGDLLASLEECVVKGELGDSLGVVCGDDLHALHHSRVHLMLQPTVLPLRVLPDNDNVNVLVFARVTGDALAQDQVGEEIQLLSDAQVEGLGPGADDGSEQHT